MKVDRILNRPVYYYFAKYRNIPDGLYNVLQLSVARALTDLR
jgi:hypothetical protein